jgi:hypothetical protein
MSGGSVRRFARRLATIRLGLPSTSTWESLGSPSTRAWESLGFPGTSAWEPLGLPSWCTREPCVGLGRLPEEPGQPLMAVGPEGPQPYPPEAPRRAYLAGAWLPDGSRSLGPKARGALAGRITILLVALDREAWAVSERAAEAVRTGTEKSRWSSRLEPTGPAPTLVPRATRYTTGEAADFTPRLPATGDSAETSTPIPEGPGVPNSLRPCRLSANRSGVWAGRASPGPKASGLRTYRLLLPREWDRWPNLTRR